MNIAAANASNYIADDAGSRASALAFSRKAVAMRHSKMGVANAEEIRDSVAPLSAIVEEEDEKQRRDSPKK